MNSNSLDSRSSPYTYYLSVGYATSLTLLPTLHNRIYTKFFFIAVLELSISLLKITERTPRILWAALASGIGIMEFSPD